MLALFLSGASFLCGEFVLHIPCWLHSYLGSFSYIARVGLLFLFFFSFSGVSLTHSVLASCLCEEFLLQIPSSGEFPLRIQYWFHFYLKSFPYTSRVGFIFMWGVPLTHPVIASSLSGEFLLHIPSLLYIYFGSSLTHTVLALFFF